MMLLMDPPATLEVSVAAGELRMPFPDRVKYAILAVSVILLLLALGVLLWQLIRCCTYTQDPVTNDRLYSEATALKPEQYSAAPRSKVDDTVLEARRLSQSLSLGSFPSDPNLLGEEEELEKQVHGCLRFSLYYDQLESRLVVTVLQAEGLQGRSQTRSLHPFVRLKLIWVWPQDNGDEGLLHAKGEGLAAPLGRVVQEWQTRVVKNSFSPSFGDQFSHVLQQGDLQHITLRMEVRDFDKFSRHTVLGEVRVPLGQYKISYPLELQEDLQMPQRDLVGEVLLSLKFLPTSQRLEVGLLKVRTLPPDVRSGTALYARISVKCDQCKLRHQRTSAVSQSQVTVFNQVLMFSLPDLPLEECKILVSVYRTLSAKTSNKHLIGQLTVGKGQDSEDQHWRLMMQSVRQPIAEWHQLWI